jgi:hypothetical protein
MNNNNQSPFNSLNKDIKNKIASHVQDPLDKKRLTLTSATNKRNIQFANANTNALNLQRAKMNFRNMIEYLNLEWEHPFWITDLIPGLERINEDPEDPAEVIHWHGQRFFCQINDNIRTNAMYMTQVVFETIRGTNIFTLSAISIQDFGAEGTADAYVANLAGNDTTFCKMDDNIPKWWFKEIADYFYRHVDESDFFELMVDESYVGDPKLPYNDIGLKKLDEVLANPERFTINRPANVQANNRTARTLQKIKDKLKGQNMEGIMGYTEFKKALNNGSVEQKVKDLREKTLKGLKNSGVEDTPTGGGKKTYKGRKYVIRTGSRGGKYILVKGNKVYI